MGLVGRRYDAAIAAVGVAVLSAGVLTAELTAAPTRAAAAVTTVAPRPATAVAPRLLAPRPAPAVAPRLVAAVASTPTPDKALTAAVREKLSHATASGYGVVVEIAGRGRVASVNPDSRLRAASPQKRFTTLPMLLANPDRRLVTQIRGGGQVVEGVLHGN